MKTTVNTTTYSLRAAAVARAVVLSAVVPVRHMMHSGERIQF